MKAAVLTELNAPLTVADVKPGDLQWGQVLVRVLVSGICGAQLQEIRGEKGGPLPHLLGHEGCGIVESIGPGVKRVAPGDQVVMHWRQAAGVDSDFPQYIFRGKTITSGRVTTFAEKSICSENRLTRVPGDADPELCAMLGCALSSALATVESECGRFGESVLVVGCGGLGYGMLMSLGLMAPARVCGCDINGGKRFRVETAGAEFVNLGTDKLEGNFDVIIDTAGVPETMERALRHLAPSGRYVMVGQPPPGCGVCIDAARHMFEGDGKTIKAVQAGGFNPDRDIPRFLKMSEHLNIANFITERFPLARINEAIDLVRAGEAGRVLIEMNP